MVKAVGSACVLAAGFLAWRDQMAERRRQRETILDLLTALRRMGETVRMTRTPLPVLLSSLAEDCGPDAAAFFRGGAEALARGEPVYGTWAHMAEVLPLPREDRRTLATLGGDLRGDEENICKAVSLAVCELTSCAGKLEQDRPAEEKRTTALCFSAAALLVILLI